MELDKTKIAKRYFIQRNVVKAQSAKLFCGSVYDPVLWLLMAVGIDWKSSIQAHRRSNCLRVMFAIAGSIYCAFTFSNMAIFVAHVCFFNPAMSLVQLSFLANIVVNTIQVLVMYAIFIFRKKKFAELLQKLNRACEHIIGKDIKNFQSPRIFTWLCMATMLMVVLSFLAAGMTDGESGEGNQNGRIDVEAILRKTSLLPTNSSYTDLLLTFEIGIISLGAFSQFICHNIFLLSYMVTAKLILTNFTHLKAQHSSNAGDKSQDDVMNTMKLVENHLLLCDVVQLFDENFREIVAIWNFAEIFGLILILRAMNIQPMYSGWSVDREAVLIVVNVTLAFMVKSILAAAINDKVKTSLSLIYSTRSTLSDDERASKINTAADFYCCSVQIDPPVLTGWRLYAVNEGLLLNVCKLRITLCLNMCGIVGSKFTGCLNFGLPQVFYSIENIKAFASVLTYVLVLYSIKDVTAGNQSLDILDL